MSKKLFLGYLPRPLTFWPKNLYLYVWYLVTQHHKFLSLFTNAKGLFWPENCIFGFCPYTCIFQKRLNLNGLSWIWTKLLAYSSNDAQHTDIWFWYSIFKNDFSISAQSWPSTVIILNYEHFFTKTERMIRLTWKFLWTFRTWMSETYLKISLLSQF